LNNQSNTFDPTGNVVGDQIRVEAVNPKFDSAEVTNSAPGELRVTFDADVDIENENGFTLFVDGSERSTTGVIGVEGGNTVVLNIVDTADINPGDNLSLTYNQSTGTVTSAVDGSDAQGFTGESVTNNVN
jgi:hypothetical protein